MSRMIVFWKLHSTVVMLMLIFLAAVISFYMRMQPYINLYKIGFAVSYPNAKLDELDPYINFWLVNYLESHGLTAWHTLTRNNPATCVFWYPNCRDIAVTELPGHVFTIYAMYQIVKFLNLKLIDFMALLPPLLSAITILGIAVLIHEISGSKIGAIVGSWIFTVMFLSRFSAGFIVKYTFGLAIAPFVVWLHLRALRKGDALSYVLAGLVSGYALTLWAGSSLTLSVLALSVFLLPLLRDLRKEGKTLLYILVEFITILMIIAITPYYSGKIFRLLPVMFLTTSYCMLLLGWILQRALSVRLARCVYALLSLCVIVIGLLAIFVFRALELGGKVALAIGLRVGGLPETVAEYQPMPLHNLAPDIVLLLVFIVLLALPIAIYNSISRRDVRVLTVVVWALLSVYATINIAYFHDYTKLVLSIIVGWIAGYLLKNAEPQIESLGRVVRVRFRIWQVFALLLVFIVLLFSFYTPLYVTREYRAYLYGLPMIARAEGFPIPSTVWIDTLNYLKFNTSTNSLVISWWDYGYWISVLGQRATVADGSTLNATQITLLAKFFVSPIDKGIDYLRYFGICERDSVYVIVFSPVLTYREARSLYFAPLAFPLGFGDIPKFVNAIIYIATGKKYYEYQYTQAIVGERYGQPIRIAFNDVVIQSVSSQLLFTTPNWLSDMIKNSTMMRLFIWGAFKVLSRLHPDLDIYLVPALVARSEVGQRPMIVMLKPEIWGSKYMLTENDFEQNLYELEFYSYTPYRVADNVIEYVFVFVFRLRDDIRQSLCVSK